MGRGIVKVIRTLDCDGSPWIRLKRIVYENDFGERLDWDYIERTQSRKTVLVIPRFKESGDLLFVRQYRVIFDRYVIGFPAGVLDDEDVETCALRELREETGYDGHILRVSPPLTANSALLKEFSHCVVVELAEDAVPKEQKLEPSEKIQVVRVKRNQLEAFFKQRVDRGDIVGGGLWYLLMAQLYL